MKAIIPAGGIFHKHHGKLATLTATQLPGRFGALKLSGNDILNFQEKPQGDGSRCWKILPGWNYRI